MASMGVWRNFAVVLLVLVAVLSGCITGSGAGSDVIDAVTPDPHQSLGCYDEGIDGAPGRNCSMFVGGTQAEVVAKLANALTTEGFAVGCSSSASSASAITVSGARPDLRVTATVASTGSVADKPIPFGWVGVNIDASEYKNSVPSESGPCSVR
jgi:predicted small secreted protein